jgi:hypothetical protein
MGDTVVTLAEKLLLACGDSNSSNGAEILTFHLIINTLRLHYEDQPVCSVSV